MFQLPIDKCAHFLLEEWGHHTSTLLTLHKNIDKHERSQRTQRYLRKRGRSSLAIEELTEDTNPPQQLELLSSVETSVSNDTQSTEDLALSPAQSNTTDTSSTPPSKRKPCRCGKGFVNLACKSTICQMCCIQSPATCTVYTHAAGKIDRQCGPILKLLKDALAESAASGSPIYVKYKKGTTPNEYRALTNFRWVKEPITFKAFCVRTQLEKNYNVFNVMDVSAVPK